MTRELPSVGDALREEASRERADTLRGPDGPDGEVIAAAVGANVARLRAARGFDPATLAGRCGLDETRLARLETGEWVPSLRTVWTLATALGVPFGALLARGESSRRPFHVQTAGTGHVVASSSNGFRSRPLSPVDAPEAPEVYEIRLAPGCVEVASAHAPHTYEHLVVVRGALVVEAGPDRARLDEGDALFFRADDAHRYENPGAVETVAHLVMTYRTRC